MDRSILTSCLNAMLTRRNAAIAQAERRKNEIHDKIPQTAAIDRELSQTVLRIYSAAMTDKEHLDKSMAEIRARTDALHKQRAALLTEAGYNADYDTPVFTCKECEDTGYIKLKMCQCLRKAVAEECYRRSGIGEALQGCTFESFRPEYYIGEAVNGVPPRFVMEQVKTNIQAYAENFAPGAKNVLFLGGTGLGKTHLSAAVGHTVASHGFSVVYESAQKLVTELRAATFGEQNDVSRYETCDLLMIDDLGAEAHSEYSTAVLSELLNSRIIRKKSMLISSNYGAREMAENYPQRVCSRLMGEFVPVLFCGTDIRAVKKQM